jgi:hypothetical protein
MKIELLLFEGCPNHAALLPRLRRQVADLGLTAEIEEVRVATPEAAEVLRFLGSPTLRMDGLDVEPGAERRTTTVSSAVSSPRRRVPSTLHLTTG